MILFPSLSRKYEDFGPDSAGPTEDLVFKTRYDLKDEELTDKPVPYKYSEDKILADLKAYLDATYGEHYKSDKNDLNSIECFDAWIALGDSMPTFRNTAIKYLWRYGKKHGNNKADLMKALHYIILCLHVDHYKDKR